MKFHQSYFSSKSRAKIAAPKIDADADAHWRVVLPVGKSSYGSSPTAQQSFRGDFPKRNERAHTQMHAMSMKNEVAAFYQFVSI